MGTICATCGLRIGEVLGLKWEDINFKDQTANVLRSFVDGSIGPCKTEVSQQPVPLDEIVLEGLKAWRLVCGFPMPKIGFSQASRGSGACRCGRTVCGRKVLQPTARKVGISKRIGWHTFRHTYCSLLVQAGNDVRVVQELMRHAKVSTTLEVYTHAAMDKKRVAQKRAVDLLLDRNQGTESANSSEPGKQECSHDVPA